MKQINIQDIKEIQIGQTENAQAGTGCTVFVAPQGMVVGLDVRGGGPALREGDLCRPLTTPNPLHALVLGGGSAYGLAAAGGVMDYLEENEIGYDVGIAKVPLVAQADIFDLTVGDPSVRPDPAMGYHAAKQALEAPNYQDGCYGAGCGATVGKIAGMETCMKSGIGSYAVQVGDLKVGAVVVVNALGDVFDWKNGQQIAGLLEKDKKTLRKTSAYMKNNIVPTDKFTANTTLGVVITNGKFTKTQCCKIAGIGQNGVARCINPVHTTADGDTVFMVSAGTVEADMDLVGTMAAEVTSEAVLRAVRSATSMFGYPDVSQVKAGKEEG